MGDLKNIDAGKISRPRDGNLRLTEDMPFAATGSSKTDVLNALEKEIQEVNANGTKILDSSIDRFILIIEGRETTPEELKRAANITEKLIANNSIMSDYAQEKLVTIPARIANHRNANYNVTLRGQELFTQLADRLTSLTSDKAQQAWFAGVDGIDSSKNRHNRHVNLLEHIDENAANGIDDIKETARSSFIQFVGSTAQNLDHASADKQAAFQSAAIHMLQKSQFPYKFDADAFREALFVVPEIIQTPEYKKQIKNYEDQLTTDAAE